MSDVQKGSCCWIGVLVAWWLNICRRMPDWWEVILQWIEDLLSGLVIKVQTLRLINKPDDPIDFPYQPLMKLPVQITSPSGIKITVRSI